MDMENRIFFSGNDYKNLETVFFPLLFYQSLISSMKGRSSNGKKVTFRAALECDLFFASKKCRELQEKIHRLAGSMNLPFN